MSDDDTAGYDTVTFLSDYGSGDEFVGVVKSVLRQFAAHVTVIDLSHEVAPFDIRSGSLILARSVQYLTPGVILAVVDPGVGTDRRAVAVEIADGDAVFVGPDNGLLAAAVGMAGGATRAVVLDRADIHLPSPSGTFAGRDVFAPVVARLCNGADLTEVGTLIDAATLTPGLVPLTRVEDGIIESEVLWVDRFGNVQLNVDPDELVGVVGDEERVMVRANGRTRVARRVDAFGVLTVGELGLIVDSVGLMALVADRASAADELDLGPGDSVGLGVAGELSGETTAVTVPVTIEPGRR